MVKCKNPNDNPNCKEEHSKRAKLCKSCAFYKGRKYECLNCGIVFEYKYGTKFCSRTCFQRSGYFSGENNAFYQWHLNSEMVKKRNEGYDKRTDEDKEKTFQLMRENTIRLWNDPKYRQHQSELKAKMISDGRFNPNSNYNSGYYKNEWYDSLWELAYMLKLDSKGDVWTKKHGLTIRYDDYQGNRHTYCPDFLVNNSVICEVKPKSMMDVNNNRQKIEAGKLFSKKNSYIFKLIHKKDIEDFLEQAKKYHETTKKSN